MCCFSAPTQVQRDTASTRVQRNTASTLVQQNTATINYRPMISPTRLLNPRKIRKAFRRLK